MSKAKKYRKKPVIVEAFRYKGLITPSVPDWVRDAIRIGKLHIGMFGFLWIRTLEGELVAHAGDYIVKGVKGEIYPVRADIFKQTYEEVKE